MPDLLSKFPAMIRAELSRRGMSQRDLARHVDTNPSTINRLLRGQGMCDVPTFVRIAAWLRVTPEVFADERAARAYRRGRGDAAAEIRAVLGKGGDNDD